MKNSNQVNSETVPVYRPSRVVLVDAQPAEDELIAKAIAIIESRFSRGEALTNPDTTRNYLRLKLAGRKQEVFMMIHLDSQHRVISTEELFHGTIDGASVYPREVVRSVIEHNSAAVILAHNHPSGLAEPSQADIAITRKIKSAMETIEVRVLDHFVVSDVSSVSFAERGIL